ncbi:hypothetical protein D3C81_567810 [compost metagenome]
MCSVVALGFALELVIAQAKVQVPLLMQGDGVEHIQRLVGQFGVGVAAGGLVGGPRPVSWRVAQVVTVGWIQGVAEPVAVGFQVHGFA